MKRDNNSYTLIRSSKRKTAVIQLKEEGVIVRVPDWVSDEWITDFVASKERWIARHAAAIQQNLVKFCLKTEQGALFPYLGNDYRLEWFRGRKKQVVLQKNILQVVVGNKSQKAESVLVEEVLKCWYRGQAKQYIDQRVDYWKRIIGVDLNTLKYKSFRRRWGSCDSQRNIVFNWRLIFAEPDLIDYVVIHELAHLIHLNHSADFWSVVQKYCPDWKSKRKELQSRTGWVLW